MFPGNGSAVHQQKKGLIQLFIIPGTGKYQGGSFQGGKNEIKNEEQSTTIEHVTSIGQIPKNQK